MIPVCEKQLPKVDEAQLAKVRTKTCASAEGRLD